MTTCREILNALWALAPETLKEDWDNPGLLCGHLDSPVNRVLLALDPTREVAQEAAALGCQLVVTHHPVTFGLKSVTDADEGGRKILAYLEKGLSLICMHTNLDCAKGGVNDVLAARLGLTEVRVLDDGKTAGLVRMGVVPSQSLREFAARVKTALGCPGVRFVSGGKPVNRVAVGGGSCSAFMEQVLLAGCDTFVTADVKYHAFCDAGALGLNLIDAGHFETENPVCGALQTCLAERFPEIHWQISQTHKDVIEFLD